MSDWLQRVLLPTAIGAVVLLLILWPTGRSGERLLRTWGIPHPHPDQTSEAVRYLWRRRILYVVLFLLTPSLIDRFTPGLPGVTLFVPLLVALLVAELVAVIRPVSGVRAASLDPRSWRDLVPRWAVVVAAILVLLTVGWSVLGLMGQSWADAYASSLPPNDERNQTSPGYVAEMTQPNSWVALACCGLALGIAALLVHLAVRRPSVSDEAVDAALRTRTARVAVGIALGWLGAAVLMSTGRVDFLHALAPMPGSPDRPAWLTGGLATAAQTTGLVAQFGSILCWVWIANPTRRSLVHNRG